MSTHSKKKELAGVWLILGAAMLWGTTGTTQGVAPAEANPLSVGAARLAVGGLALLAFSLFRGSFRKEGEWSVFLVGVSAFFVAAYQLCFFSGVAKTGVAVGTMVAIGSAPVFAGILGYFVRKERLGIVWGLSTLMAVAGCLLLVLPGKGLHADFNGILLAAGAGFSYAGYTVTMKGLLEKCAADAVVALVFSLAAVLLAPFLFLYDASWIFSSGGLLVALHLGIMTTAVSYWLFAKGLKDVNVGTAATLSLAEPLTATCLGIAVLHERLMVMEYFGMGLLFVGIVLLVAGPAILPGKRTAVH